MSINGIGGLEAQTSFHRRLMAYRSPFSPTEEGAELYLLRGAIISAFGHADYLAMLTCVRAAHVPNYRFRKSPPTTTKEKMEYLNGVVARDGPLAAHKGLLQACVSRLKELNEYRTIVAHASYQALGHGTISFPDTMKSTGKRLIISNHNSTSLKSLRSKALRYARFSRACESLYYRMDDILPKVRFQRGWHSNQSPWRDPVEIPWPQPIEPRED